MNLLSKLLAEKDWLMADGATGTNLFNRGLEAGEAPELWNVDQPEKIRALYQDAVDSGSDIFLTNSFGGTAARLKLHNAQDRVRELNRVAAALGRDVADKAGRPVVVAGSVGPTGEIFEPLGPLSHAEAVEMFQEQGVALMEGGADVLWLETISAPEEYKAAAEAFANINAPWVGTMSFDTAGRTMMGITSSGMVDMVHGIENRPVGFGANCGVGASDLLRTIQGFTAAKPEVPIVAKGNAGIPKFVHGHIHYDGTPELMGKYAVMVRDSGAKIIGGCCGTMPEHLKAMRKALEETPMGPAPSDEEIQAVLGGYSSDSDGTGAAKAPKRVRRRQK